ncbi:hypothetical protein NLI96_g2239 [Meripilus lineatus]|uniref:Cytochrome P450 n=1 Tax=Meripilus lineatus TaxID=2056292 RepID=A0AAD5YGR4_9APHY|nr:hypothetical protein NLI96_g2239 [Physisporinus lineatus]
MISIAFILTAILIGVPAWWLLKDFVLRSPLDKIPGPPSPSLLAGHLGRLFHRHEGWKLHNELASNYGPVSSLKGGFGKRMLYVRDPTALHSIIIKDQQFYEESSFSISMIYLVFGEGLIATLSDQHRKQRKMLNPVFSINHMRHMTPIFYHVAHKLREGVENQVRQGTGDVDILNWMGRTALELIGQGGLGYSFDPLVKNSKSEYGDAIKATLPAMFALGGTQFLVPYLLKLGPPGFRRWVLDHLLPDRRVQHLKDIADYLDSQARSLISKKRLALKEGDEAVTQQVGEGKDIMSILMRANMAASESERLTEEELVGQMSILIFAATDTTSGALSQILQLLAEHPDAQERLRKEILDARAPSGEDIPYDQLIELPYMDAICRETLRLFPPVTDVYRDAKKDMVLPLASPIRDLDGKWMSEIPIPNDTRLIVSIRGCNRSKQIWGEDANEWKPERWLSPLPGSVTDARVPGVYSNMMTFLGGGRSCIGFKFSQLEMKVVLSLLLGSFKFSLPDHEIVWNLAGVKYPTVGRISNTPSMPMKVELLNEKAL